MNAPAPQQICLITGSRGYLGGAVKSWFESNGWRVIELIRSPSQKELSTGQAIRFRLGDEISLEPFAGAGALVHCAYDFGVRSWEAIASTNVLGSEKLFLAARRAGIHRTVFISTMSAFEGCKSLYGKAKLGIEKTALAEQSLVLRPGLIHGDSPRGMFGNLASQVKTSKIIPLFGDGSQVLYLSHLEDLCRVIYDHCANDTGDVGEPVIAAHDQGWTFRQILEELGRVQRKQLRFLKLPWRLIWLAIKGCEVCRIPLKFRSDSLVSLMNQDLSPSFESTHKAGFDFRPFQAEKLKF